MTKSYYSVLLLTTDFNKYCPFSWVSSASPSFQLPALLPCSGKHIKCQSSWSEMACSHRHRVSWDCFGKHMLGFGTSFHCFVCDWYLSLFVSSLFNVVEPVYRLDMDLCCNLIHFSFFSFFNYFFLLQNNQQITKQNTVPFKTSQYKFWQQQKHKEVIKG